MTKRKRDFRILCTFIKKEKLKVFRRFTQYLDEEHFGSDYSRLAQYLDEAWFGSLLRYDKTSFAHFGDLLPFISEDPLKLCQAET